MQTELQYFVHSVMGAADRIQTSENQLERANYLYGKDTSRVLTGSSESGLDGGGGKHWLRVSEV